MRVRVRYLDQDALDDMLAGGRAACVMTGHDFRRVGYLKRCTVCGKSGRTRTARLAGEGS